MGMGGGEGGDNMAETKTESASIQPSIRQVRFGMSNGNEEATASIMQPPEALWA